MKIAWGKPVDIISGIFYLGMVLVLSTASVVADMSGKDEVSIFAFWGAMGYAAALFMLGLQIRAAQLRDQFGEVADNLRQQLDMAHRDNERRLDERINEAPSLAGAFSGYRTTGTRISLPVYNGQGNVITEPRILVLDDHGIQYRYRVQLVDPDDELSPLNPERRPSPERKPNPEPYRPRPRKLKTSSKNT